ncbi:MAG TPA: FAD-binding protein [Gaiellaceae bacterium]|nr:FAD-binding protein [Gaiellaceae bacterium]
MLTILGGGMAGLVAAARARELGLEPVVHERGMRPGGSMLLSSCVIWRYRSAARFAGECPGGDPALQALVVERLDDAIAWLESLGAEPVWQETGNPRTVGKRFDPARLTELLVRAAGDVRLGSRPSDNLLLAGSGPLLLATGGFQGSRELIERYIRPAAPLRLRANPWSAGDGLRLGLERGARLSSGLDEFYGRNMPDADFAEPEFVPLAQLYGRFARVFDEDGVEFFPGEPSWSEVDLVQETARRPGARAWYVLDEAALSQKVRDRTVAEMAAAATTRLDPAGLPFPAPPGSVLAVRVAASITHTVGGLAVDTRARTGVDGLWAAGADAGGIATGGYCSGLASALVLGLAAAEDAAATSK